MIYLWEKHKGCTNKLIAVYNRDISTDRFLFLDGIYSSKEQISKPLVFDLENTKATIIKYDCMPNNSESQLVNQKVVDILLKLAPNDVQFFDAEVRCSDSILTNYKLINATSTIIGIDHEKSIITMMKQAPDTILGFRYLTYKPGCMRNHKLARDKEYLGNLLVTQEIKQAFEKEKIKGVWFARPEEFYGYNC